MPSMFGFAVYGSYQYSGKNGHFPFPCPKESVAGGHAVVAVGYDDAKKIKNPLCGKETTGALLIRNSWGLSWAIRATAGYRMNMSYKGRPTTGGRC